MIKTEALKTNGVEYLKRQDTVNLIKSGKLGERVIITDNWLATDVVLPKEMTTKIAQNILKQNSHSWRENSVLRSFDGNDNFFRLPNNDQTLEQLGMSGKVFMYQA